MADRSHWTTGRAAPGAVATLHLPVPEAPERAEGA